MGVDLTQLHGLNYSLKRSALTLPYLRFAVSKSIDTLVENVTQDCVSVNLSKFVLGIIPPIVATKKDGKLEVVNGANYLSALFAFMTGGVEYPCDGEIEGLRAKRFGDISTESRDLFMTMPIQIVIVHKEHKERYLELVAYVQNK